MDFNRPELVVALFAFTLLAVLAIGLYQKFSVRRSQLRRGEPTGAKALDHLGEDRSGDVLQRGPHAPRGPARGTTAYRDEAPRR